MSLANITISYPWWFLLFCVLCGIGYAYLLYRNFEFDHKNEKWGKPLLFVLRSLAVSLICFLLLTPIINHISNSTQKPTIVIGLDQSESVGFGLNNSSKSTIQAIDQLADQLSGDYDVEIKSFAQQMYPDRTDEFKGKSSDLNAFFEYVNALKYSAHVGGVVLLSDGLYNQGPSPLFESSKIKSPIYTIAIGDTLPAKDLSIKNIVHNEIGFLGDITKLQVDIQSFNLKGEAVTVTLSRFNGSIITPIQSKQIFISKNDEFQTVDFSTTLNVQGLQRFQVNVTKINGESTFLNNQKDFFIDVINTKVNINILAAAPHPDLGALKTVLEKDKNYSVNIHFLHQNISPDPKTDLWILHSLPSSNNFAAESNKILDMVSRSKKPIWFIAGLQTDIPRFNRVQQLVKINASNVQVNDVYGSPNQTFNLFQFKPDWSNMIGAFPPLQSFFGNITAEGSTQVLMHQRIGQVQTKYPLWVFGHEADQKFAVLLGEGIWRWKLNESKTNTNIPIITDLVNSTVRYLITKDDKRKFKIVSDQKVYDEIDQIIFNAELYNDSYQLENEPDVKVLITNDANKQYNYTMAKSSNAYTLDIGSLPPGQYQYKATTQHHGKKLEAKGTLSVNPIQKELFDLQADFGLLQQMADQSGGELVHSEQILSLVDKIKSNEKIKPQIHSLKKNEPLINLKWIFFIIALSLALEWILRRTMGKY